MICNIENKMDTQCFEEMRQRVLEINTNIDKFIQEEMKNHEKKYCNITGKRFTNYYPDNGNLHSFIPIKSFDDVVIHCETVLPLRNNNPDNVVLYIHGAAFQRRVDSVNLKTIDRFCSMLNQAVFMPDYRIGSSYKYVQMLHDVVATYMYIITKLGYKPENISIIADSSGTVTALQMIKELAEKKIQVPSKIVLWSPIADGKETDENHNDIAFKTNDLYNVSLHAYLHDMCKEMDIIDVMPIYGCHENMKGAKVLIQAGKDEILLNDAIKLYNKFNEVCETTLEIYEDMFHNFQTYYSICDMARVCWDRVIEFITL